MSKDEKCTCKACKTIVFHCQICKFVRFLLPSSSCLLKLPIVSAKELLDSLNIFEKYSGLKMNISETKAMWIGTMKNSSERPLGLE